MLALARQLQHMRAHARRAPSHPPISTTPRYCLPVHYMYPPRCLHLRRRLKVEGCRSDLGVELLPLASTQVRLAPHVYYGVHYLGLCTSLWRCLLHQLNGGAKGVARKATETAELPLLAHCVAFEPPSRGVAVDGLQVAPALRRDLKVVVMHASRWIS